ncbi:MAG: hypothetical protein HY235_21220 [Acidobacteria bacterium]|nr:hypothetical protein [Acidobacteriota bacterium]
MLDHNFDPPYQLAVHHAQQKDITIIGGYGSGKTEQIIVSAATWAATTSFFKFLNVAPVAWQSKVAFDKLVQIMEGTPFHERFVAKVVEKPYPKITLRYLVGEATNTSTLEFMSADKNASKVKTWEGDWVNLDQAEQVDELDETIEALGTRVRGLIRGRERLGRLSLTANSEDNPQLWYRFDFANELPNDYLSVQVSTYSNRNLTPEQIRAFELRTPEGKRAQALGGDRPEGGGQEFPNSLLDMCVDPGLTAIMQALLAKQGAV